MDLRPCTRALYALDLCRQFEYDYFYADNVIILHL